MPTYGDTSPGTVILFAAEYPTSIAPVPASISNAARISSF